MHDRVVYLATTYYIPQTCCQHSRFMNLKAKDEISLSLYREREYKAGQQGNVCRSGILSLDTKI